MRELSTVSLVEVSLTDITEWAVCDVISYGYRGRWRIRGYTAELHECTR